MTVLTFGKLQLTGEQLVQALAHYGMLSTLLEQLLLDFEVLPRIGVTETEMFELLSGLDLTSMPTDAAAFERFLIERADHFQLSIEALKSKAIREIQLRKLKGQFEAQVESEFLRSRSHFEQVEFSLIQMSDFDLASEVFFQTRDDGADFGKIAEQYSQGSERQTQGWVGPIKLSTLPEAIRTVLQSAQVGQIHGPLEINGQYCIVRLERFHSARLTEALRTDLLNALFGRWLSEQTELARRSNLAVQVSE